MSRNQRRQFICSFCGKNQDQVQRLIAGPGAVYVCSECIDGFSDEKDEERCSFCGKTQSQTQYIRKGPGRARICNECIALCRQIIVEEEHTIAKPGGGWQRSERERPPEHDPHS